MNGEGGLEGGVRWEGHMYFSNMLIPCHTADADFNSLLHSAGGHNDGVDEPCAWFMRHCGGSVAAPGSIGAVYVVTADLYGNERQRESPGN